MRKASRLLVAVLAAAMVLGAAPSAYAYDDPGGAWFVGGPIRVGGGGGGGGYSAMRARAMGEAWTTLGQGIVDTVVAGYSGRRVEVRRGGYIPEW